MTIDDKDFAKKITGYLDRGSAQLKVGTTYKLQLARAKALERLAQAESAAHLTLAGAHGLGSGGSAGRARSGGVRRFWNNRVLWAGIVLIVASGVWFQQWQATQQVKDIEETDAAILSSDLPIDAYLDRGFQNWLKLGSE
jgi:hypothetical protein